MMKVRTLTALLSFAVADAVVEGPSFPSEKEVDAMWTRFQADFKHNNPSSASVGRRAAFGENVIQAVRLNFEQGVECKDLFDDERCVFGITVFSDMSQEEFKATKLGYKPQAERTNMLVLDLEGLPNASRAVDWRQKGAVTPVKDQGSCGSCWAFSTTEEVESQVFMKTGKLPVLSTQQIISCDKVDQGCNGGDTPTAYAYIKKAGGLDTAADYPDRSHSTGETGKCSWDGKKVDTVTGFTYATKPCTKGGCKHQNEDALATALAAKGPVSICVNAGGDGWQVYKRGVFSAKCSGASQDMDHCVQLVGFDKSGDKPYWIVRNSWAASWGIEGYMHLEMGKNLCGVANEATIAEVTSASEQNSLIV